MVRYIIEKIINNGYAHGVQVLIDENGEPKIFTSEDEARKWLVNNDEEYNNIPITQLINHYKIKPHII